MIYPLASETVPPLGNVGGKARSLMEATAAGFPVPDGCVLSVEFFQPWFEQVERSTAWAEFLRASQADIRKHCDAVKEVCAALELTAQQRRGLEQAMQDLPEDGLFAVRSSSPEEDLEGSSFAGGYETTLGVTRDALERAILRSFTSVFDQRVVQYKIQHQMATHRPRIAVVVQRQIASDVSGVAFSLNPQNNCFDEAVINANFGLGESVVEGRVTPDTYVVEKVKREILEKRIAQKSHALWLVKDGGTREARNERPDAPSLTAEQALAVTDLASRSEARYGRPMDIEWAIEDGKLYLLQARPITRYVPLSDVMRTEPGEDKHLYLDLIVLTQGFSEPLSVLGGEIWGKMLEGIKGELMFDRGRDGTLVNVAGRQYFNLSHLMQVMGGPRVAPRLVATYDAPTRKIFETLDLENDYLPKAKPDALKGALWNMLKSYVPMLARGLRAFADAEGALRDYEERFASDVAECRRLAAQELPLDRLIDDFMARFKRQMDTMGAVALNPMLARWRLGRLFKRDQVDDLLVALEMDLHGNPSSEMGHRMYELACFPEIRATADGAEFQRKIESRSYSAELLQAYDAYMDRFGCRGIKEIDVATPRVYEDLPGFFEQLRAIDVRNDTIKTARTRRAAAHQKLLELACRKGKGAKFERLARIHRNAGTREAGKYFFIVVVDLLRRRALASATKFVEQGRLENAEQVFGLRSVQITEAERDPSLALLPLVEENLADREGSERVVEWPRVIDSRGKIFRPAREDVTDGLVGDAIAPGLVRGRAKVLHAPYEKPVEKGEILVTRASDPGWTPIFINAAGVVLEVGGPLQHGAIIAREYGLPCVSGLDGVTATIQDGQLIEVDGSNGVVRIVPEDMDAPEAA